jgi:phosphatidylserine decarboxylase
MKTRLFILLQYLLPQHGLSRLIGKLANCRSPRWLVDWLLQLFIRHYKIDLSIAAEPNLNTYPTFNAFFIRQLKPSARPVAPGAVIVSPVDGVVSQATTIANNQLLQAKGRYYTLEQLLAGDSSINAFKQGLFTTIYLSPRDYHRVHMPYTGKLLRSIYVPGKLFSVNPTTVNNVDAVFARNERLITLFETEFGLMAVILVGAMLVAGIGTSFQGIVVPNRSRKVQTWNYADQNLFFEKGTELGYFNFGSTVIILLPKQVAAWLPEFTAETSITLGTTIARINGVSI